MAVLIAVVDRAVVDRSVVDRVVQPRRDTNRIRKAVLAAVATAALFGGFAAPAAADENPCTIGAYGCDSHWMDQGEPGGR
ncbi:hypothetical protein [Microbispora sp. H11081]|uniref:hypothetical protein n=1 Tax=Microbispora sp. H11081 TaxID=2729107 RepID=UPI001475E571|nr:hypothetical protein [Microbispora sp. H11081]